MKGNIFIKRPVMAMSIAIMILLVGIISFSTLPLEQYPDIAPPTVTVTATYTGASADAVMKAVIQPLEEGINGVENMLYMSSTATNSGSATINVIFKQGTDPDMAAVNVQNRVSRVQGLLPQEVTRIGVSTIKRQTSFLQIDALCSEDGTYDEDFISNYLDINVIPQIKRVEGVGELEVRMQVKGSRIKDINLVGDYFLVGDLDGQLLKPLKGVQLDAESISRALPERLDNIILNLSKEAFIQLILNYKTQ